MTSRECHGRVLEYDAQRGYGRIQDDQGVTYFVHYRDIIEDNAVKIGEDVCFEATLHRKGNIARQVRRR